MAAREVPRLDFWLRHIAAVHPLEIELGLDRVRRVAKRLSLHKPAPHTVVVAGTNGKGSCIAALQSIVLEAGYRAGSYTSPHLHRFNERIRLDGEEVSDRQLCESFAAVEKARGEVSLSYFEFATLAALYLFEQSELDIALLEVGLGGRLDAVNIVDGDICVITDISLDHQNWLGEDLESIAAEKAGILRRNRPAVCSEREPAGSVLERATRLGAPLFRQGREFQVIDDPAAATWSWQGVDSGGVERGLTGLSRPRLLLNNVAAALQALMLLPVSIDVSHIRRALRGLGLAGRLETRRDRDSGTPLLLDVAHNPASAELLAQHIGRLRERSGSPRGIAVVMAVMADKDIEGMAAALESCVDIWYIAQVEEPRCMPATEAASRIERRLPGAALRRFDSVKDACRCACEAAGREDLVVITGSFHTVAVGRDLSATD